MLLRGIDQDGHEVVIDVVPSGLLLDLTEDWEPLVDKQGHRWLVRAGDTLPELVRD